MIIYEDNCVGCPSGMGCIGDLCKYRNVPHVYCDGCDCEDEIFYEYEGEYFCKDCYIDIILENANKYTAEKIIERGG